MHKPSRRASSNIGAAKRKGTLSKVAGAGTGSAIIVWVDTLNLSPTWKIVLEAAAPWVAVAISFVGPIVAKMLLNAARYRGTQFLLNRMQRLHDEIPDIPENAEHKSQMATKIRDYQQTLSDILHDTSHVFRISSSR